MPPTPDLDATPLPFVDHLERESALFRAAIAAAPAAARVPTCPDWDADDLLWHLADVQWFWGEIAQRRLTSVGDVRALVRVERPTDRAGLLDHFDTSTERLVRVLRELPADTELWMWADDHSAGYIARRQAHEALVHRLDAELTAGPTAGTRHDVDPALAADGVDEALTVMRGHEPDPSEPDLLDAPVCGPVTVSAVDVMHSWTVTPVRVTGRDSDGDEHDLVRFRPGAHGEPGRAVAEISGSAADLDAWLWNRPMTGTLERSGDAAALAALEAVVTGPID